jgi:hypothetical protein
LAGHGSPFYAQAGQSEGATVDEVASVTGWQRHSVRGVFSGTLKKKLGLTLASANRLRGLALAELDGEIARLSTAVGVAPDA